MRNPPVAYYPAGPLAGLAAALQLVRVVGWPSDQAEATVNRDPFVSALACYRVHRTLGFVTIACAGLVAISTLFTKQHYVADIIAGIFLALVAYAVFLRGSSRAAIPELHRCLAPYLALVVAGIVGLGFACYWVAYRLGI